MTAFIDEHRGRFGVEPICKTLDVSASAYYLRKTGARSARSVEDEQLLERILKLHADNYYAYGARRMWKALTRAGETAAKVHRRADHARSRHPGRQAARQAMADHTARPLRSPPARPRSSRLQHHRHNPQRQQPSRLIPRTRLRRNGVRSKSPRNPGWLSRSRGRRRRKRGRPRALRAVAAVAGAQARRRGSAAGCAS